MNVAVNDFIKIAVEGGIRMGKLPKYFYIEGKAKEIIENKLTRVWSQYDDATIAEIMNAYLVGYAYGKYYSEDSLK